MTRGDQCSEIFASFTAKLTGTGPRSRLMSTPFRLDALAGQTLVRRRPTRDRAHALDPRRDAREARRDVVTAFLHGIAQVAGQRKIREGRCGADEKLPRAQVFLDDAVRGVDPRLEH